MRKILLSIVLVVFLISYTKAFAVANLRADQIRAEIARLSAVADVLRAKIAAIEEQTTISTSENCLKTNLRMKRGDSGTSVTELQIFLANAGVYSPSLITGYFGPATELAVKAWQANNGIVSYGTPSTTGYGLVGPATLRAMHLGCPNGVYTGPNGTLKNNTTTVNTSIPKKIKQKVLVEKYSLSINPTKGVAPLPVSVIIRITGSTCTSYSLDWGDGSAPVYYDSARETSCNKKPINITRNHIYKKAGDFDITFKTGKAPLNKIQTVNTVHIQALNTL